MLLTRVLAKWATAWHDRLAAHQNRRDSQIARVLRCGSRERSHILNSPQGNVLSIPVVVHDIPQYIPWLTRSRSPLWWMGRLVRSTEVSSRADFRLREHRLWQTFASARRAEHTRAYSSPSSFQHTNRPRPSPLDAPATPALELRRMFCSLPWFHAVPFRIPPPRGPTPRRNTGVRRACDSS